MPRRPMRAADTSAPPGTEAECCACSAGYAFCAHARVSRAAQMGNHESESSPENVDMMTCGECE